MMCTDFDLTDVGDNWTGGRHFCEPNVVSLHASKNLEIKIFSSKPNQGLDLLKQ